MIEPKQLTQEQQDKLNILQSIDLDILPPEARSVLYGFLIDGLQGGLDAAAVLGLSKLPPELQGIAQDLLNGINWVEIPAKITDLVGSFFGDTAAGLTDFLFDMAGGIDLSSFNISNVFNDIFSGNFGGISKFLGDLGSIPFLSNLLPNTGILNTVSNVLNLFDGGLGNIFNNILSDGGFGLSNILNSFGVSSTLTGLIGPLLGLFGLSGANSSCPCEPSCRKTSHFITEDGDVLLDKCSSIIPNSSSSYLPSGTDVTNNNNNPISTALGLVKTGLGEKLIPATLLNLTEFITGISRMDKMAERVESSRNADFPDWQNELIYTFKAIENGFKVNDNNVTKIEEILALLLKGGLFSRLFNQAKDNYVHETLFDLTRSVVELQRQTAVLDAVKVGGAAGAVPSEPIIKTKGHVSLIKPAQSATNLDWLEILDILQQALAIWNSLNPGNDPKNSQAIKNTQATDQNNNTNKYGEPVSQDGIFDFPSIDIAFNDDVFDDKYSDLNFYQQQHDIYSGLIDVVIPEKNENYDINRALQNRELSNKQIDEILVSKFINYIPDNREENLDLQLFPTLGSNPTNLPDENIISNDFLEPLQKIYEYYEQETINGQKNYC